MKKLGKRQSRFTKKMFFIFTIIQIPVFILFFYLFRFNLPIEIFFGILLGFSIIISNLWYDLAHPEVKLKKNSLLSISLQPYFIWVVASGLSWIPALVILVIARANLLSNLTATYLWLVIFILALIIAGYGVLYARKKIKLASINIPTPASNFKDYKIIHISDIHLGNLTTKTMLDNWVKRMNLENPDLIAITGDFITFGDAFILDLAQSLGQLKAKDGVYCCLGNHDYFQSNYKTMCEYFTEYGLNTLINQSHFIKRNDQSVCLSGIAGIVDNTELQSSALKMTLTQNTNNYPVILLAHDPLTFKASLKQNVFLTLSGHTHAGQIANPFNKRKNLASRSYLYTFGLYKQSGHYLYVTSGLGCTHLPFRFGARPEVTIINLK